MIAEHPYDAEGTGEIRLTLNSGRRVDLRTIKTSDILIEDVAHALSNLCRFAGHVPRFYSVAQHSVIVSKLLPPIPLLQLQGLLHDATEAYLVDLPHFVKHAPELAGYRVLESKLERLVMERFGLPLELDPKVKAADRTACDIEWRQLKRGETISFLEQIVPQAPIRARRVFLEEFRRLSLAAGLPAITRVI